MIPMSWSSLPKVLEKTADAVPDPLAQDTFQTPELKLASFDYYKEKIR